MRVANPLLAFRCAAQPSDSASTSSAAGPSAEQDRYCRAPFLWGNTLDRMGKRPWFL